MDRDPLSARYCAECGGLHPAEEGDFWAESSLLGLKITYFAMMDGKIYDITGECCFPEPPDGGCAAGSLHLHRGGVTDGRMSFGRVGRLPACGDQPGHPPRPLPHLLWLEELRAGRAAEVMGKGPDPHPGEWGGTWDDGGGGGAPSSDEPPPPPETPTLPPAGVPPRAAPHQLLTCRNSSPASFRGAQDRCLGGPSRHPPTPRGLQPPPGFPPGLRAPSPRATRSTRGGRRCVGRCSAERRQADSTVLGTKRALSNKKKIYFFFFKKKKSSLYI